MKIIIRPKLVNHKSDVAESGIIMWKKSSCPMLKHLTNHKSDKSQFFGEVFSLRKRVLVQDVFPMVWAYHEIFFPGKLIHLSI